MTICTSLHCRAQVAEALAKEGRWGAGAPELRALLERLQPFDTFETLRHVSPKPKKKADQSVAIAAGKQMIAGAEQNEAAVAAAAAAGSVAMAVGASLAAQAGSGAATAAAAGGGAAAEASVAAVAGAGEAAAAQAGAGTAASAGATAGTTDPPVI